MEILLYACCVKALPLLLFFYGFSFHEHLLKFTSCASKETMSFDEVYNNNDNKRSSQCYAVYGLSKLIMMMRWFCWHIINLLRFVFSRVSSVWRKFNVLLCCAVCLCQRIMCIIFSSFILLKTLQNSDDDSMRTSTVLSSSFAECTFTFARNVVHWWECERAWMRIRVACVYKWYVLHRKN